MTEYPIIFSADMVKAILEDRKTMTRRVIKPQPKLINYIPRKCRKPRPTYEALYDNRIFHFADSQGAWVIKGYCPYGQVGDRLWVRETFVLESDYEYGYTDEELKRWAEDRPIKTEDAGPEWGHYHLIPHYRATEPEPNIVTDKQFEEGDAHTLWKPSIHMPRWASRITLEITEVRVERLQEITHSPYDEDCHREGFDAPSDACLNDFMMYWNKLNAKWKRVYNQKLHIYEFWQFPWCAEDAKPVPKTTKHPERYHCVPNPWVRAISFKRLET